MPIQNTPRRTFLGTAVAAAASAVMPSRLRGASRSVASAPDDWMDEVPGENRCLFDFNQHKNGFPLLHILNYLSTYAAAYGAESGQVGAAATLYGIGTASSISLGFDDTMWAKYSLGEYTGLQDASGRAYTRNPFHRPTEAEAHLLSEGANVPALPIFPGAAVGLGIESLQGMGTKFIMCQNALNAWSFELEARGNGVQADINAELTEHLLPGVTIVPAMVIAIEKAQEAGIRYNKQ